jgi:rubredoxin
MPAFFGFILGVILTVGCAYVYDSSTGRTANGLSATSAGGQAPMVNWTIVSDDWQSFQTNVRSKADNLEKSFKLHS